MSRPRANWYSNIRIIDGLQVLRELGRRGWSWVRRFLGTTIHSAPDSRRSMFGQFVPHIDLLEGRLMPSTSTWTGGGTDDYWSTTANWSGGVPSSSDTAVINNSAYTVVLDSNVTVANLSLHGGYWSDPGIWRRHAWIG